MHLYIGANPLKRHLLRESGCMVFLWHFRRHLASSMGTLRSLAGTCLLGALGLHCVPQDAVWGDLGGVHTGNNVRDGGRMLKRPAA